MRNSAKNFLHSGVLALSMISAIPAIGDETEVDRPLWRHWLTVIEPEQVATGTALLIIGGGSNESKSPSRVNPLMAIAAVMTRSVIAELRMVPNQPLTFVDEAQKRSEDGIIAY